MGSLDNDIDLGILFGLGCPVGVLVIVFIGMVMASSAKPVGAAAPQPAKGPGLRRKNDKAELSENARLTCPECPTCPSHRLSKGELAVGIVTLIVLAAFIIAVGVRYGQKKGKMQ